MEAFEQQHLRTDGFAPLDVVDGYLPIADYGLIGDGATAGLVGRDGTIAWLCVPRFDAPALFCSILDAEHGGAFRIVADGMRASRQYYLDDSGVLVTELQTTDGLLQITDALVLRADATLRPGARVARGGLVRAVKAIGGEIRLRLSVAPRGRFAAERRGEGVSIRCDALLGVDLQLDATVPLPGLSGEYVLRAGEERYFTLRWGERMDPWQPERLVRETHRVWQRWITCFHYAGPQERLVRRAALTLKMLDYVENGAMVAAPTSSLPEAIGGTRNWDYRYAWVRDAAFYVFALGGIGMTKEVDAFLRWVLNDVEREPDRPHILYTLDGGQPPPERQDPSLEGYRRSSPVRWGNAAADQRQHDVFGEILDCAYQWARESGAMPAGLWRHLRGFVEAARREWRTPDHGIWEVRTPGHTFTYSAALCHVALDRGARLAERFGLPGDVAGWRNEADHIRRAILNEAWDPGSQALTEHLSRGALDASVLTLPLRGVLDAREPRMVATVEAIVQRLGAGDGLLYRYLPDESPDGVSGHEGAFLLCSFWLVDNLVAQGRLDEGMALYDSLCARANPLGLLPEQIDPASGAFLGNYPQAFSHVGLIASGRNIEQATKHMGGS